MNEQDKKFYATSAFLMIDDLKKENEELKAKIDKANEYNNYLIEHCKYNLNKGHLRKMKNILRGSENNE